MIPLSVEIHSPRAFKWKPWKISTKEAMMPESWDEVTTKHLKSLGRFFRFDKMKPSDEFKVVKAWSGMPVEFFNELSETEIFELLEWIYKDVVISRSLLERYRIFSGARSHFKNFNMDRFGLCDELFKLYMETGDDIYLKKFSAVYFKLMFLPFSKRLIELNLFLMRLVPRHIMGAALINFVGIRKHMMHLHPHVFTGGQEGSMKTDWEHITLQLSGGVFGDVNQTRKMKIPVVLKYCEMSAIEAEKRKRKKA